MKITITKITRWGEDKHMMDGDASREGYDKVLKVLAAEVAEKKDEKLNGGWEGLPFVLEWSVSNDEDEAVTEALDAYIERFLEFDYLKPTECDYEVWFPKTIDDCATFITEDEWFWDDELLIAFASSKYADEWAERAERGIANPREEAWELLMTHGEI